MRDPDEDSQPATDDEAMSGSDVDYSQCSDDDAASGSGAEPQGSDADGGVGSSDDATSEEADLGVLDDASPGAGKCLGYRVIDAEAMKKLQRAAIDDVAAIWGCGAGVAKTLLMSYMWDKERLLNDLGDKGEEHVYKMAGLVLPDAGGGGATTSCCCGGGGSSKVTCSVCLSDLPSAECSRNSCGHAFCDDCWRGHLKVQVGQGKARHVVCMSYKCGIVCDDELVVKVMKGEPELLSKYNQSHVESYLEDNQRVAFCPSVPWCGHAIEVDGDPYVEPECPCGVSFCFKCSKAPHSPCTCKMWEMWEEKMSGDSETRNWLAANTKPCPKCTKPVEKNGGCNLVVCKCGQPFCWLCGQATGVQHTWTSIANHSCGRFKDEMDVRVTKAAAMHKRYMFYFERFKNHLDSIKKEKANRAKLLVRISDSEHDGVEARDYSWLVAALDQLRTARRVLCNSYAFAYYFFGGSLFAEDFTEEQDRVNRGLFEDNQEMLAAEVERLSGLADRAGETLSLDSELRYNVINSSSNIATRISNLFSLIENDLYAKVSSLSAQIAVPRG